VQFYSYGQDVIDQMNGTSIMEDVEQALKKFSQKPKAQQFKQYTNEPEQQVETGHLLEGLYDKFGILSDPHALENTQKSDRLRSWNSIMEDSCTGNQPCTGGEAQDIQSVREFNPE
jgi:hypothetical protein